MGAWIEITMFEPILNIFDGRTPRWVRGLKSIGTSPLFTTLSRTPRWVRGLKSRLRPIACKYANKVAPHDGCVD